MDPDRCPIQLWPGLEEGCISPTKCLKHEQKLTLENAVAHAGTAEN